MIEISVVIPVYGCPAALQPLHERLTATLKALTDEYEIILVNDGCPKNSWKEIVRICAEDKRVKGINLSRNFGQIHATNAGLDASRGQYVVLMDCDLQDKPEGITALYQEIKNSKNDIVYAKRKGRKDNFMTLFWQKLYYKIYNVLVDGYFSADIGNFSIVTRQVVDAYCKITEKNKSYAQVLGWMGFDSCAIEVDADERYEGKSSYSFRKKIGLALNILTSQSNRPLRMCMGLGVLIAVLSVIYLVVRIIMYIVFPEAVPVGWTSIVVAIFFMGGVQLMCLGGVGIYIGNIFDETRGRQEYIVKEILNDEKSIH